MECGFAPEAEAPPVEVGVLLATNGLRGRWGTAIFKGGKVLGWTARPES